MWPGHLRDLKTQIWAISLTRLLNGCHLVLVFQLVEGQNGLSDIGGVRGIVEAPDKASNLVVLTFPNAEAGILASY